MTPFEVQLSVDAECGIGASPFVVVSLFFELVKARAGGSHRLTIETARPDSVLLKPAEKQVVLQILSGERRFVSAGIVARVIESLVFARKKQGGAE